MALSEVSVRLEQSLYAYGRVPRKGTPSNRADFTLARSRKGFFIGREPIMSRVTASMVDSPESWEDLRAGKGGEGSARGRTAAGCQAPGSMTEGNLV